MPQIDTKATVHNYPRVSLRPGDDCIFLRLSSRMSEIPRLEALAFGLELASACPPQAGEDEMLMAQEEAGIQFEFPGGCWPIKPHGSLHATAEGGDVVVRYADGERYRLDPLEAYGLLLALVEAMDHVCFARYSGPVQ